MINPRTYEQLAGPLSAAGEHVSLIVGQLLKRYWQQLIQDPTDISDVRFTNGVIRETARWNREAREWTEQELALAYIQGLQHTDGELEMISQLSGVKMRKPTRQISPNSPLLPNIPLGELLRFPLPEIFDKFPDHRTFVGVFQRAAHYNLEGTDFQILRASQGLARDAAIQAGDYMFSEGDTFTRRNFAQKMLNEFAKTGVKAVKYRNGRTVSIDAYAEMVGRSLTGRCAMQASLNRYQEYGYDLLRVSAHFRACPLCTPWEGRILSHSGQGSYPSLQEAAEAGLFHSNCAHDLAAYIPGISEPLEVRMDPAERELVTEQGYKGAQEAAYLAQQRQRQIERNIRTWKRREAVALDATERTAAHQKVLQWQGAQREHLQENPYLPRKYVRESITRAH